jgi:hypothetical protein
MDDLMWGSDEHGWRGSKGVTTATWRLGAVRVKP